LMAATFKLYVKCRSSAVSKAACFGCGCHAWSLALLCWYGTGHAPQFSALKVSSGFAFVASFNWYICGASLFFETFAPVLVWAMFLAILSLKRRSPHEMGFAGLAFVVSALAVAGSRAVAAAAPAASRCADGLRRSPCILFSLFPGLHRSAEAPPHGLAHFRAEIRFFRVAGRGCNCSLADLCSESSVCAQQQ
jgi:hypothetical protein